MDISERLLTRRVLLSASIAGLVGADMVAASWSNVAHAAGFDNGRIATEGLKEVGSVRATGWNQPGECVKSVQRWVAAAGGNLLGGGPHDSYADSGAQRIFDLLSAARGDVVQYVHNSYPDAWLEGVHTFVIVNNLGGGLYDIVQSNSPGGSGKVTAPKSKRISPPPDFHAEMWRLGEVGSTPNGGLSNGLQVAFQANTGNLWTARNSGNKDYGLGMKVGTNPAITTLAGGSRQVAFQANTGNLWTTGSNGNKDSGLGMKVSTSPAITSVGVGFQIAFQANTGKLWTTGSTGNKDCGLGMAADTSPGITTLANGGCQMAIQANTGNLWTAGSAGNKDYGLGMGAGTSPAIAAIGDSFQIAFQANTGKLWTIGRKSPGDLGFGMMRGTSPAITRLANGDYQIAFQANTGDLWTVGSLGTKDWGLGMMRGTSPSITAVGDGFQVAFQANTGKLWTVGEAGDRDWGLGMMRGTSPLLT